MAAANAHLNGGVSIQSKIGRECQGNAFGAEQYGQTPGDPNYMKPYPPGHPALPQSNNSMSRQHADPEQALPPVFPWLDNNRGYMAGLTRSIVEARLAQQEGVSAANLYGYVGNNPVNKIDPSGLQETWDPGPNPPDPIQSRQRPIVGCNAVADCLNSPSRETCNCGDKSSSTHDNSIELMICISWQETNWGSRKGTYGQPPGGVARCTKSCFDSLRQKDKYGKINCPYLAKYKDYDDFRRNASSCEKLWAAQDFLGCVGLKGFGPPYPQDMRDKLTKCASCIRGGCDNVAIANAGYPCAAARGCVNDIHT